MPEFTLRAATSADIEFVFRVRNDPMTREASRTTDPVAWDAHERWFNSTIVRVDRRLLIGEASGASVSTIRFDDLPHGVEANWMVAPEARRRGFGFLTVREGIRIEQRRPILAEIKPSNRSSVAVALRAGFVPAGDAGDLLRFTLA
jgi:L-amino acid N-acyltransferase YncA